MSSLVIRVYAVIAVSSLAAYLVVPSESVKEVLYLFAGLVCLAGAALGVWLHRPGRPRVWQTVLAGMLLWTAADLSAAALEGTHVPGVVAFLPDALYLLGYLTFATSLALLAGGRSLRGDLAGALESVTVTAALALLAWVVLGRPTLQAGHENSLATFVSLAYPTMDILLIAGLVRLILTPGARTPSFRLVLAAVWLLIAGDFGVAASSIYDVDVSVVRIGYFLCYLLWGAAALHPSMTTVTNPGESVAERFNHRRLAALTLACTVAPGVLITQAVLGTTIDVWAAALGSVVLTGLVIARMTVAIHAIEATQRERERLQADLVHQASHDALTGLPNRARAVDDVASALGRAQRSGYLVALLFIDLDGFKNVNDTFGHATGDDVLRTVADRLRHRVRSGDVVARLGGDEFVVLLENVDHEADALAIAKDLVAAASEPVPTDHYASVRIGASIGLAIAQDGSRDPDRLLREADAAVYRAKAAGRGRVEVFGDGLRRELAERVEFDEALLHAIARDELVVHYQPVIDLRTGRIHSHEALVRWQRPGHGLLPPDDFVPVAERSMIVCDLDAWVMQQACLQLARWKCELATDSTIAVNVSGRYLSTPRIVDDVRSALDAAGIAPQELIIEITETVLLEDVLALEHIRQLRHIGVAISLDDFGTGYASIALLRNLPVDIIKIDRSYLRPDQATRSLLRLMVEAAHSFGLPVIVEGVERASQLDVLRALRCESAQGFHLGIPAPADEVPVTAVVRAGRVARDRSTSTSR